MVLVFRDVADAYRREQQIREHEGLLKSITANVPGVVYQFHATPDHQYDLRFVSEKGKELFGVDPDSESFLEILAQGIPERELEGMLNSIREAVDTVSPWRYEGRFVKPSGDVIWISGRAVPHRQGERVVFGGVLMDISDVKAAQEESRQRRQFIESVLYHAPDAIVTMDAEQRVIDWNPGAERMFGYTPDEVVGRNLDELVAFSDASSREAGEKIRRVMSGKRIEAFETVRYRKDGSPLHGIAAGSPIMDGGTLKGVVGVYTDITARNEAQARIRESHERFLTVLESVAAAIYVADMETYETLYMNQRMKQVFGADMTGRPCWQAFRNADGPCQDCTNSQLLDPDGNPADVCVWEEKNAVTGRWYVNHDRAIRWVDGRIVRLQVGTDVTRQKMIASERKGYEKQIQQHRIFQPHGLPAGRRDRGRGHADETLHPR